jgi:hypothetical protein
VSPEIAARLEKAGISLAAQTKDYCLFVRENCMALAHAREGGVYSMGSSGIMTEKGVAYLVWKKSQATLAIHGAAEIPASKQQVEELAKFSKDLGEVLGHE